MRLDVYHHTEPPMALAYFESVRGKLQTLLTQQEQTMATLTDFIAQQQAFNTANAEAIAAINGSVDGIAGDIANLNQQILNLQGQVVGLTPEEQAALDAVVAQASDVSTKLVAVRDSLAALDAITPPAV